MPRLLGLQIVLSAALLGATRAQTVHVRVEREESAAVVGLDEQLAAFEVTRGQLVVQRSKGAGPDDGTGSELSVVVCWTEPTKGAPKGFIPARVASSDPGRAQAWFGAALAGEGPLGTIGDVAPLAQHQGSALFVRIEFPHPRGGRSKARQFRHVRRFMAVALAEFGMLEAADAEGAPSPWPRDFPAEPVLALYDAEGTGGSGCASLERVVDSTTLRHRVLVVCPEDVREGGLRGAAAVIFPGGSGGGIARALQPAGVAEVRRFVEAGGGYVGICAGAYFAGSGLESYAALVPWRHTQPWAKGRATLDVTLTEAGRRLLGDEFARFTTRYHNGPVYPDVLGQARRAGATTTPLVLGEFATASKDDKGVVHEAMVGTPAIVADTCGKGRVLLLSPHPESHAALNLLVARALAWAVGTTPEEVVAIPR